MACETPIRIKAKKKVDGIVRMQGNQIVPCGKCYHCRLRRVNDWVFRLQCEEKNNTSASFVTLTYNNEKVPLTSKKLMTVKKTDIQKFLKRLRFNTGKRIKYYCAAEYGSKTMRPHYHLIIFNATRDEIDKAWQLGDIHIGNVTSDSIAYTLKYISKEKQVPQFKGDDRTPEFSLSSTNLGINYINSQTIKYHNDNYASYYLKPGGYRAPLPRIFRNKILTDDTKEQINKLNQDKAKTVINAHIQFYGSVEAYHHAVLAKVTHYKKILKEAHLRDKGII